MPFVEQSIPPVTGTQAPVSPLSLAFYLTPAISRSQDSLDSSFVEIFRFTIRFTRLSFRSVCFRHSRCRVVFAGPRDVSPTRRDATVATAERQRRHACWSHCFNDVVASISSRLMAGRLFEANGDRSNPARRPRFRFEFSLSRSLSLSFARVPNTRTPS